VYSLLNVGVNAWVVYTEPLACAVLEVERDCVSFCLGECVAEEDGDGVVGDVGEGAVWPELFDDVRVCELFVAETDVELFFHFADGGFGEGFSFLDAAAGGEIDALCGFVRTFEKQHLCAIFIKKHNVYAGDRGFVHVGDVFFGGEFSWWHGVFS